MNKQLDQFEDEEGEEEERYNPFDKTEGEGVFFDDQGNAQKWQAEDGGDKTESQSSEEEVEGNDQ